VPTQIREYFTPQDGSDDRMLFIFPSVERRQGKNAIAFADDMYPMTIHGREYIPTGDSLIFADMLRVVVSQGLWIFGLSILAITLMLFVQYRRIRDTWHTLLSLLLGLALMSIFLHITRLQVNFYNMVIFAAIVGMGIDAGIHLYSHWIHERSMERSLSLLGGPITASMLTTMAGYSGMITSTHNGLKSIGLLAVIGLSACGIAALTVYPMYLRYLERQ
jgi:uncharacterized protein